MEATVTTARLVASLVAAPQAMRCAAGIAFGAVPMAQPVTRLTAIIWSPVWLQSPRGSGPLLSYSMAALL